MKKRAATLVELLVALSIAAIVATIAGKLLFDGLETWRREADRDIALRRAYLAANHMAQDLAAQAAWTDLPAPVSSFDLAKSGACVSFFVTGADSREVAVCWYLCGTWPCALMRYEASADATAAALPANAADVRHDAALVDDSGATIASLASESVRWSDGVTEVKLITSAAGLPQILLKNLTPEGRNRAKAGEPVSSLPERCQIDIASPVAHLAD